MIIVNCLGHSGFSVESETHMLIFDYSEGILPNVSDKKKLYYFVSHAHEDHYDTRIFSHKKEHPYVRYVLSSDIPRSDALLGGTDKTVFVDPGDDIKLENKFRLLTLPSTDCGVAYLCCNNSRNIFHAGDLNLWLWERMSESQVYAMTNMFRAYTQRLRNFAIDTAFLPLDSRLGMYSFLGFDYYMKHFRIKNAIPMHFFGSSRICEDLINDPISREYRSKIIPLDRGRQVILK